MAQDAYCHRVSNLLGVVPFVLAQGIKPAELLRRVGLPPYFLLNPDSWIPRRYCLALGNALREMTGDRYAALHLSEPVPLAQYGAWTQIIEGGPSLRSALLLAGRHIDLIQTGSSLRLRECGRKARLVFEFIGRTEEDPLQYVEGALVIMKKLVTLAEDKASVAFAMEHRQSSGADELERVLGPYLGFKQTYNGLEFDRSLLDLPLTTKGRPLPSSRERPEEEKLLRVVMGTISDTIQCQAPTVQTVALVLGLHVRTLQRKLDRWGTTYEALLDSFRKEKGMGLVENGGMTSTDIAFRLGYSDSSHFIRAFRRWTGHSPRDYAKVAHRTRDAAPYPLRNGSVPTPPSETPVIRSLAGP